MRKYYYFSLFLLLLSSISFAQDRSNYSLLWEIEHKDSDKKSYLFGTMHLRDKRVFDFSDALLPAIKQSEVFALEINPENVASKFIENLSKKDFAGKYEEILSSEEYQLLTEKIEKSTGKKLDELKQNSPDFIETVLRPDLNKEDDKDIFLDAYLYQIAASLDKEIAGLEDIKDQMTNYDNVSDLEIKTTIKNIINYEDEDYVSEIERLIEIYVSGDISEILAFTSRSGSYDAIMKRRNETMVKSMKEIMKSKSLFTAVGAAHLPGDIGIINMLRDEGFTVRKVESAFTGKSNNYTFKPNLDSWKTISDSIYGYKLQQPSSAQKLDLVSFTGFNSENAFIDLKSGASFFYFALDITDRSIEFQENAANEYVANMKKRDSSRIISSGNVMRNTYEFSQVITKSTGKRVAHFEIISKDGIAYFFGVEYSPSIAKATAESFFNSIDFYKSKLNQTVWQDYTDQKGAFSMRIPGELKDHYREIPNPDDPESDPFKMSLFLTVDKEQKQNYLIRYNNFPVGYYLEDVSDISQGVLNQLKNTGSTILSEKQSSNQGFDVYDYEILIQGKYHSVLRYIPRGNRTYVLLAQSLQENAKAQFDNPLFNSFEFKPYTTTPFQKIENNTHHISFVFPEKNKNEKDTTVVYNSYFGDTVDYVSLDENTGGSYSMYLAKLKKYFRVDRDKVDTFFDEYIENYENYGDTIYKTEKSLFKGYPSKTYYLSSTRTPIIKKYKFLLIEDQFVVLGSYLGDEELNSENSNQFFNTIGIDKLKKFDSYSSKAKMILKDLKSEDSLVRFNALGALDYYEFEKSEKKLLEKGLTKEYDQDTAYYGIKNMLIYHMGLIGDDHTVTKLKEFYHSTKATNRNKLMTIYTLPKIKTDLAIKTYFDVLEHNPPVRIENDEYPVLEATSDSILNYKTYGNDIFKLIDNESHRDKVIAYWKRTIANDSTSIAYLQDKKALLFKYLKSDVDSFLNSAFAKAEDETIKDLPYNSIVIDYISLLSSLEVDVNENKESIEKLLNKINKRSWYIYRIYKYYINNSAQLDQQFASKSLEDIYYRLEVMQFLSNVGKEDLIPEVYFGISEYGKLSLYNSIGEEYGYPDLIEYKEEVEYANDQYDIYLVTYTSEDEDDATYLGIVKKGSVATKELNLLDSYYTTDPITDEPLKEQAIRLLKSLEE